jgi:hypothetical protein
MAAIALKEGRTTREVRWAARASDDTRQVRRLLALAAILNGMSRTEAAKIGSMDRQNVVRPDLHLQ